MAREFKFKNTIASTFTKIYERAKWQAQAYSENGGLGPIMVNNYNFVEMLNYGLIDHRNYSVIPVEKHLVFLNTDDPTNSPRVFDFVADSFALMRLNFLAAAKKNLFLREAGSAFEDLQILEAYKSPRQRYDAYITGVLSSFNENLSSNISKRLKVLNFEQYIDAFMELAKTQANNYPITMSRFNKSIESSILDSGLAIKYFDIPYDFDQRKIDEIIDHPSFAYFKNLCLNFGFSIAHNNPNIIIYDPASPANSGVLGSKQIYNLDDFFDKRFAPTYIIDMDYLINNLIIYYNNFVLIYPQDVRKYILCGKTFTEKINRTMVNVPSLLPTETKISNYWIEKYVIIRNIEEGYPFMEAKIKKITKHAKRLNNSLDKLRTMRYISNEFKDQVWNKNHGYHDLLQKLRGGTFAQSGRRIKGQGQEQPPIDGGSTTGGGSSGY